MLFPLNLILTCGICFVAIGGDKLLEFTKSDLCRAVVDSSTHGTIGLLTWAVVVNFLSSSVARHHVMTNKFLDILISGVVASAIDLDHFALAKSFSLKKAMHLEKRPILHCTSIWIVLALICFLLSKIIKLNWLSTLGWLLTAASLSHHIRDGTRRGLWFWPFGSTTPIPYLIYIAMLAALPFAIGELMNLTVKLNRPTQFRNFSYEV